MKFKIPFTFSKIEKLKSKSRYFSSKFKYKKESKLGHDLKNSDINLTREEYLGICMRSAVVFFGFFFVISTTILLLLKIVFAVLFGFLLAFLFSIFIFFSQRVYPRIYVSRKQRDIEKNLIPGLEDILVQLNSGVPLFNIISNIADADYGSLSLEFKKAVKRINAGEPEAEVFDSLGKSNPSVFFRRTLWQISNGMKAGSDIAIIIRDSIKALNEEQLIQIQAYGSKLNPLVVLYMLISVIIPALSVTFLTIISSMVGLSTTMIILLFIGLFVFDVFAQIMFLGLIKSRKPSLL
ncbi:MAG: type II secretion system F family protein [Candidatus Pacearchaeota archaeon]